MPLTYLQDGLNRYVIIASNGGMDTHPGWFFNLKHNPQAKIQVGSRQITVQAEVANPEERGRLWEQLLKIAPGYGNYQKSTIREIPVVILQPQ